MPKLLAALIPGCLILSFSAATLTAIAATHTAGPVIACAQLGCSQG